MSRGQWSRGAVLLLSALLASCASAPEQQDPRSTSRTLASAEVDALLLGNGMGMAAAAEINGYPGPLHVLELKDDLELTPDQRFATSRLIGVTQGKTRSLGQRIVEAERRLDADMASGDLSRDQLRTRLETIAALRAQLRFAHMEAHLQQKKILTDEQVRRYYELRGRDVVLPEPVTLPAVTEPLTLPADTTPAVTPAPVMTPAPLPVEAPAGEAPAVVPMPVLPLVPAPGIDDIEPAESAPEEPAPPARETPEAPALEDISEPLPMPVEPEVMQPPAEAPHELTPGMMDAMPEAEPAPVTIEELPVEEVAPVVIEEPAVAPAPEVVEDVPALPPPSTRETITPAPVVPPPVVEEEEAPAEPAKLSPGMLDAMEEAEPGVEPATPPPLPVEETIAEPEIAEPEVVEPAPVIEAAPVISPGMQDAMEEAEPVTEPMTEPMPVEEESAEPEVVEPEVVEPAPVIEAAPAISPGMQDPMEEAEPVTEPMPEPVPVEEESAEPEVVEPEVVEPAPAIEAAPAISPGMQDAMEEAEPVMEPMPEPPPLPAEEAIAEPEVAEPEIVEPAPAIEAAPAAPATLSPGMMDALEFSEPVPVIEEPVEAPVEETIYIAPLEEAEDELREDEPIEPRKPVTVDLDNRATVI